MPDATTVRSSRARPAPEPPGYHRRRPETTVLSEAIRQHLRTFLAEVEARGEELPAHVQGELDRFLDCGILAHGFVRVRCATCKDDLLVAFSCKGRGICPSCGARRMADTAARWVDGVLPRVPWRQWVLSLPFELRFRLAWDPPLLSRVLQIFQDTVAMALRRVARRRGLRGGQAASVTVVQRFGSALNLNVHFHSLVADGLWLQDDDDPEQPPRFVPLKVSDSDVVWVVLRLRRRVHALLRELELLGEDACWAGDEPGLLQGLAGAATKGLRLFGPKAGQPVRRIGRAPSRTRGAPRRRKSLHSAVEGFDVHAAVRVSASDRKRLEHLARYLLRPALPLDRLELLPDGSYAKTLRRPWADGTTAIQFEPMELMARLAALVPLPRANLVRYHGALAPAAALRPQIVPRLVERRLKEARGAVPERIPWAELPRRVFGVEVLRCAGCGGRRELVAAVTEPLAALRILEHLGLDPSVPWLAPVRAPPGGWSWAS